MKNVDSQGMQTVIWECTMEKTSGHQIFTFETKADHLRSALDVLVASLEYLEKTDRTLICIGLAQVGRYIQPGINGALMHKREDFLKVRHLGGQLLSVSDAINTIKKTTKEINERF